MNLNKKRFFYAVIGVFIFFSVPVVILWKKIDRISKMERFIARRQNSEILNLKSVSASLSQIRLDIDKKRIELPDRLKNIKCAGQLGIVKKVRTIDLDPIFAPYNPSIIENDEGGYHLFFRYDVSKNLWQQFPFYSYIGYAELNSDFSSKKIVEKLNTKSLFSEDPRVVKVGKDFFVSWNDTMGSKAYSRTIHIGKWNAKNCKLEYVTNLDQNIKPIEKNWVPFERSEKDGPHLSFVYGIQPHKILDVPSPKENDVSHLINKTGRALNDLEWPRVWGSLCGGATARLVDNEYISFFHSYFKEDNGGIWYVMGAYTFEAKAPYNITSITPYPITFQGIYESPFINTADSSKHTIYPSGIALEKKGKKQLLHVSCGENDCAVKVITIDYEKLREHMVSVK